MSEPIVPIKTLCSADAQALDALMEVRARQSQPTPLDEAVEADSTQATDPRQRRLGALLALLALLDQYPVQDPPADLLERTLAKIDDCEQKHRFTEQVQALTAPPVAFRWREFIGVAAMILLALSLAWPMLAQTRSEARRVACATNLASAGQAYARYASDNQGLMPRLPIQPRSSWAMVGQNPQPEGPVQSNSAHLYLLARKNYLAPATLNCPDNDNAPARLTADMHDFPNSDAVSYSSQNQYSPNPIRLDRSPYMAVLADKNPLFVAPPGEKRRVVYRPDLQPTSPTIFHRRSGQNILTAGGNVLWSKQPVLSNGDNIWLATGIQAYNGTEIPAQADDSFLVP